jgi:hypothetical protein
MHYTASVHFAVRLITNFSVLGGIWNFDPWIEEWLIFYISWENIKNLLCWSASTLQIVES